MPRSVYRPWIQTALLSLVYGLFLLLSAGMFASGELSPHRDAFSAVLYALIGASGAVGLWRALRMATVIDERGIRLRTMGRDRFIGWPDVSALSCEPYVQVVDLIPVHAPVAHLGPPEPHGPAAPPGGAAPHGGAAPPDPASAQDRAAPAVEVVPLTGLGSLRPSVARRRTDMVARRRTDALARPPAEGLAPAADDGGATGPMVLERPPPP